MASAGDYDGDGLVDVVTTIDKAVYVLSGTSGAQLLNFYGGFDRTSANGIGDFDGDGVGDVAVGAPGDGWYSTPYVRVFSLGTGTQIFDWSLSAPYGDGAGLRVRGLGDVDGDGKSDFLDCNSRIDFAGTDAVDVFTSVGPLYHVVVTQSDHFVGPTAAKAGDVDGDGHSDFLIGSSLTAASPGSVDVMSGATGSSTQTLLGEAAGDYFGLSLAGVDDMSGDGVPDFVVGAPQNDAGGADAGRVYAYSGSDAALLHTWTGEASGDGFGSSVAFVGDIDRDGTTDVAIVAPHHGSVGTLYVYSGQTGSLSFATSATGIANTLSLVAGLGDVDGDGIPDLGVGDIGDSPSTEGLSVLSGDVLPHVSGITPSRTRYTNPEDVTITGRHFLIGTQTSVLFAGQPATNVVVVDDSTITCTSPTGEPGPATIAVQNTVGTGSLDGAFSFTPAVLWEGNATPGGSLTVHYLCDPLDGLLAIIGTDPANVPTPPFDGALGIVPFQVVFVLPPKTWPFDHFDLTGNIPNDPSLVGVSVLLQALDGPSFARPKNAAWTNVAAIAIQ